MSSKHCVICKNKKNKKVFSEFGVDVLRCENCGHVFSSFERGDDYGGYYEENVGGDNFWWNKAHEKMYDDFCSRFLFRKSGRILDVGCGFGYFVKKIEEFPDWDAFGYEISQKAVEFAKNKLGLKNIFCGRVENSKFDGKFDIITLWDVIEHIPNPDRLLTYLNRVLKGNGFLFIHTPNVKIQLPKAKIKKFFKGEIKGGHYMEAKDHLNIYSLNTIKKVLMHNGFNHVEFVHLHPIQSVAGSKSVIFRFIKNLWFYFAVILFYFSFKKININNLFVVARK